MPKKGADFMLIGLLRYQRKFQINEDLGEIHVRNKEEIIYLEKVGTYVG